MTTRERVFESLNQERKYQDEKWGTTEHEPASWILFMEHHLSLARGYAGSGDYNRAMHEVRKVTALGVAAFEQYGVFNR